MLKIFWMMRKWNRKAETFGRSGKAPHTENHGPSTPRYARRSGSFSSAHDKRLMELRMVYHERGAKRRVEWWPRAESNCLRLPLQGSALPMSYRAILHGNCSNAFIVLVEADSHCSSALEPVCDTTLMTSLGEIVYFLFPVTV